MSFTRANQLVKNKIARRTFPPSQCKQNYTVFRRFKKVELDRCGEISILPNPGLCYVELNLETVHIHYMVLFFYSKYAILLTFYLFRCVTFVELGLTL